MNNNQVKMGVLLKPDFQAALVALMNSPQLPVKTSYALLNVYKSVSAIQSNYEDLRNKLLDKYGQKDSEGNLAMNEAKTQYLLADRDGFDKDFNELLNLPVEVVKVPLSLIEEAKLSPAQLMALVDAVVDTQL